MSFVLQSPKVDNDTLNFDPKMALLTTFDRYLTVFKTHWP